MDDSHGDRDTTDEDTQSIHTRGQENRVTSLQSIRIDNGCNSIRCVMKSVDEFECTDEEETEPEGDIDDFHRKDE